MPFTRSPLTLRQVLGGVYFIGIAVLAVGVIGVLGQHLSAHFREDLLANGRAIAEQLAEDSRIALIQRAVENVRPRLETAADYPNVAGIALLNRPGETLVTLGANPVIPRLEILEPAPEQTRIIEDDQHLVIVAPVRLEPESARGDPFTPPDPEPASDPAAAPTVLGYMVLTLSQAALQADIRATRQQVLVVLLAGAVLVGVLVLGVLDRIIRPLQRLAGVMSDPDTVQHYRPVEVGGVREAQTIATAFNALIAQVAETNQALVVSNAALTASQASLAQQVEGAVREVKQQNAELIVTREQALAASRVKSEFMANMSHEIRTPMHGFMGFIDMLAKTPLNASQKGYLHLLKHSANSLLVVINSILDFSKLEAGKTQLQTHPFKFREMVENTVHLFTPNARAKDLKLEIGLDSNLPEWVLGDRQRLAQIVRNLVDNAIKFTQKGGVRVDAGVYQNHPMICRLVVQDTGIGISPKDQAVIFTAFNQVDASTTRQQGGTGLGLAICQQLVALMKGRIDVRSQEGIGSTFYVEVPLILANGAEPVNESLSDPLVLDDGHEHEIPDLSPLVEMTSERCLARQRRGPTRVLVVDDNATNRIFAKVALSNFQTEVVMAENGHAALKACQQQRFDLIVMDIRMPGLDGLETTRRIRQWRTNPNCRVPIIGLTADLLNVDHQSWKEAGMNDCFFKPLSEEKMNQVFVTWGIGQPPEAYSTPNFLRKPS